MFRIAHISDPHLGPLPEPGILQLCNKRILGYINWQRNRNNAMAGHSLEDLIADIKAQNPNHLAITGDLVNLALPEEFLRARKWLESLGKPEDISIILGNHDAYTPGARFKAEAAWQAFLLGDDKTPDFPYLRIRKPLALIGVNSALATGPFMATGRFCQPQASKLATLLHQTRDQGLFRLVMIHHPPDKKATHWHKRLIGDALFRKILREEGAELVLHGHTHLATKRQIEGPNGPIPVICVPSASQAPGGHKPAARYNLFEISGRPQSWSCTLTERGLTKPGEPVSEIASQRIEIPTF